MNRTLLGSIIAGSGLALTAVGFILAYAAFPALIDSSLEKNLDLWDEESEGRKNFVSFFLFVHVTASYMIIHMN